MSPAVTFLAALFERSSAPVFVTSLANDRAATQRIPPRQMVTRDGELVDRFVEKWDWPERALYFCVATLRPGSLRRAKANLHELVCLHCDLDFAMIDAQSVEEILEAISRAKPLPPLPSLAVFSGHGLHFYWRLRQPCRLRLRTSRGSRWPCGRSPTCWPAIPRCVSARG